MTRVPSPLSIAASLAVCALAAAPLAALAAQDDDAAALEQARKKLHSTREDEVRAGGSTCVQMNSPAAVELLLEVLGSTEKRSSSHLPPEHFRDVVWESLVKVGDRYARQRVAEELTTNKQNAFLRQWCAELLGLYGDGEAGDVLVKALSDKDEGVVQAAARSLGQIGKLDASAGKALAKLAAHKNPYLRANAIESMARLDPVGARTAFDKGRADKDAAVRCALLGALPGLYPDEVEALSTAALGDADWKPRLQAVENLSTIRTKSAVDALISALRDGRPRVAASAVDALQELTGQKHRKPEPWEAWWKASRESFEFPDGRAGRDGRDAETTAAYNGILFESDHVAFLIDKSEAMRDPLESAKTTRNEAARAELELALSKLQGALVFTLFTYAEDVRPFEKKPVELTKKSHKQALEFVEKAACSGDLDVWQALERVVRDPEIDTAFLLTSGEPDRGLYVHGNRISAHLKDLNRFHKVVIHVVAYSVKFGHHFKPIAEATGGEYKEFE